MPRETNPTVLIVDDDLQVLKLFEEFLNDYYSIRTATGGKDAMEQIDEEVDVVLLDRRMPDGPGKKVLADFRDKGFDGPIAMITAVDPDVDVVDMGFDDYFVKPVTEHELQTLVETLINRAAYSGTIQEYFALVSKVAALESEYPVAYLENSEEYRELCERLAAIKDAARSKLKEIPEAEFKSLFRGI